MRLSGEASFHSADSRNANNGDHGIVLMRVLPENRVARPPHFSVLPLTIALSVTLTKQRSVWPGCRSVAALVNILESGHPMQGIRQSFIER